jgi:hypothetical protein
MVYASQAQRERYEETKAAYANGGDAVRGVRKRYFDFGKKAQPKAQPAPALGGEPLSRVVSPGEIDETDMARLSLKADGTGRSAPKTPRTPGMELTRPKVRERVSYGFPRV